MSAKKLGVRLSPEHRARIAAGARTRPRIHGLRRTPEYAAWEAAKARCYNANHPEYKRYGKVGVRMCDEWLHDPAAFIAYAGRRPSPDHSLDRIDPWGSYEPENVRWATWKEQARNRRRNLKRDMHVTGHGLINAILYAA